MLHGEEMWPQPSPPLGGSNRSLGVLKEQRGMRQFRRRGLETVAVEMALAATAYNLTRMWNTAAAGAKGS